MPKCSKRLTNFSSRRAPISFFAVSHCCMQEIEGLHTRFINEAFEKFMRMAVTSRDVRLEVLSHRGTMDPEIYYVVGRR
jgi:hypothetical protein